MGKFFGMTLLLIGVLLFLNVLGLGWLFRFLLALLIIIFAMNKIKKAETSKQKTIGIAALLFGLLLLAGGFHVLFGLLLGLAFIYIGYQMLKRDHGRDALHDKLTFQGNSSSVYEDPFDMEWNKKMKE